MVEDEKYLQNLKESIESGIITKNQIKNFILQDRLNDKISFKTYRKAIKMIENVKEEETKRDIFKNTRYITDPKEEQKLISMMKGKHKINLLTKDEIDENNIDEK